jgi:hypothetical protein
MLQCPLKFGSVNATQIVDALSVESIVMEVD